METEQQIYTDRREQDAKGSWTNEDILHYGETLLWSGERLSKAAIYARYLRHNGPSPALIEDRFNSLNDYYHELGLVGETKGWEEVDYVSWYRKLLATGLKENWTARELERLSGDRRGPSAKSIIAKLGSIDALKNRAGDEPFTEAEIAESKLYHRVHEMKVRARGQERQTTYSETLRLICIEGTAPINLSAKANALLALLFKNVGVPVFPTDFYERIGNEDMQAMKKAWEELRGIADLKQFFLEDSQGSAQAYGLVFNQDDLDIFVSRLAFIQSYPSVHEDAKKLHQRRNAVAAAIGVASVAGAAILGYRHHKKNN